MPQHRLGDVEIGNHTVPQRSDRNDVPRGSSQHFFRLRTHGQNLFDAPDIPVDGNNGRLA